MTRYERTDTTGPAEIVDGPADAAPEYPEDAEFFVPMNRGASFSFLGSHMDDVPPWAADVSVTGGNRSRYRFEQGDAIPAEAISEKLWADNHSRLLPVNDQFEEVSVDATDEALPAGERVLRSTRSAVEQFDGYLETYECACGEEFPRQSALDGHRGSCTAADDPDPEADGEPDGEEVA